MSDELREHRGIINLGITSTPGEFARNQFTFFAEDPHFFTDEDKALHAIGPVHGPARPVEPEFIQAWRCNTCGWIGQQMKVVEIGEPHEHWGEWRCPECDEYFGCFADHGELDLGVISSPPGRPPNNSGPQPPR